jgi:hypothetical protein
VAARQDAGTIQQPLQSPIWWGVVVGAVQAASPLGFWWLASRRPTPYVWMTADCYTVTTLPRPCPVPSSRIASGTSLSG